MSTKTMDYKTKKATKGWPPERRKAQARRIYQVKPWQDTTGPRTEKGKAKSRLNALKHGERAAGWRALRTALTMHKHFLKQMNEALRVLEKKISRE